MDEYKSKEQLFKALNGAFNVKIRLINKIYPYIKKEDIWNYLKINKWRHDINLTISEMTNDIINVDAAEIDEFLKEKLKHQERELVE